MKRFLYQTLACVMIIGIFVYSSCHTGKLSDITKEIGNAMSREYRPVTISELYGSAAAAAKRIPEFLDQVNETMTRSTLYGEPIDEKDDDGSYMVHSVCGGTVTEIGENNDIGRYAVIRHGTESESVYGNLSDLSCILNERVRKGDIIGTYDDKCGKGFYYSLDTLKDN